MIRGKVNQRGQPRVAVEMLGRDGRFQQIEFVLDTGFGGDLLLESDILQELEVIEANQIDGALATGQSIRLRSWRGTALWHDQPIGVVVLEADGERLLGMNLLRGSRVTLDVLVDGDVTIAGLLP